jgi:hypothetical protein
MEDETQLVERVPVTRRASIEDEGREGFMATPGAEGQW